MRGLWLEAGALRMRDDLPSPEPATGEAVVALRLAGVCNTDLELVRGYYPFAGVPGHEFVGEVVAAPSAPAWLGKRVVGEINAACGVCPTCLAGRRSHCPQRSVLGIARRDGAFAERLVLPIVNLHLVPDELPDTVAVFTEPVAAALEIQQQVAIDRSHRVVVIGDGKLGQLVAQTLALTGCDLLVIGRHADKLAQIARRGIRTATAAGLPRRAADVVVECTGNSDGVALARDAVRPRGTIVLKSTYRGDVRLDLSAVVVDEITLVGSRCGPFALALAALAQGQLEVESLVHARYPLEAAVEALEHAARPGVLKVLIEP